MRLEVDLNGVLQRVGAADDLRRRQCLAVKVAGLEVDRLLGSAGSAVRATVAPSPVAAAIAKQAPAVTRAVRPSLNMAVSLRRFLVATLKQRNPRADRERDYPRRVVPAANLFAFMLAALVLIAVPGPSVLFVISRGVVLGRRAALATVPGNCAGVYVQVIAVALGVGVLVERSAALFATIKLAGAVYLVWLGSGPSVTAAPLAAALGRPVAPKSGRRILREGFVVGLDEPEGGGVLRRRPAAVRRSGAR